MKRITISVDDETYRRVHSHAAVRNTTVAELVRQHIAGLVGDERNFEALKKLEAALRDRIGSFRASDRLSRDEVHTRTRYSESDS